MKRLKHSCLWLLPSAFLVISSQASTQAVNAADLDHDGLANIEDRDVDNDGILNEFDPNIDGGTATSGLLKGQYVGDGLNNTHPSEADMDADGNANDVDFDMDGDGVTNDVDEDFNCDGIIDMIDFSINPNASADQEVARPLADPVIKKLNGFRLETIGTLSVSVDSTKEPSGGWNLTTPDGISINGYWHYPADKPEQVELFAGELEGERRIYAQYPDGAVTTYSWLQGEEIAFCFTTARMEKSILKEIHQYVMQYPNPEPSALPLTISDSTRITFGGDLPPIDFIGTIEQQQRGLFSAANY